MKRSINHHRRLEQPSNQSSWDSRPPAGPAHLELFCAQRLTRSRVTLEGHSGLQLLQRQL